MALAACSQAPASGRLGVHEARELIRERAGDEDFVVLDVRTPAEWKMGVVEGAVLMNYHDDFKARVAELDRDKTYLLYCHSGGRSAAALRVMEELGFENVIHMPGGFRDWSAEGLPLVPPDN